MNGKTWFVQMAVDRLAEWLPLVASRFLVGKLERWSKFYLIAQFVRMGVLCGWAAMTLCIVMGLGLFLVISYALVGAFFTIAFLVGWLKVSRIMPEVESELAKWLSSRGRQVLETF